MSWFQRICRQTGLMVHQVVKPVPPQPKSPSQTKQVSRKVEEEKISPNVTLRRTTIEEIEISGEPGAGSNEERNSPNR